MAGFIKDNNGDFHQFTGGNNNGFNINLDTINEKMLGVPSDENWIDISLPSGSDGSVYYIAPNNGYIVFTWTNNSTYGSDNRLYNKGQIDKTKLMTSVFFRGEAAYGLGNCIPVKKGDNVFISFSILSMKDMNLKFVPCEVV